MQWRLHTADERRSVFCLLTCLLLSHKHALTLLNTLIVPSQMSQLPVRTLPFEDPACVAYHLSAVE